MLVFKAQILGNGNKKKQRSIKMSRMSSLILIHFLHLSLIVYASWFPIPISISIHSLPFFISNKEKTVNRFINKFIRGLLHSFIQFLQYQVSKQAKQPQKNKNNMMNYFLVLLFSRKRVWCSTCSTMWKCLIDWLIE